MSTKHIRTAADLVRFGAGLRIECGSCGNTQMLDGFEIARRGGTGRLQALTNRLKCSRCGEKDARLSVLSPPAPRS